MNPNYNGLTVNEWPGTWVPSAAQPIVLGNEIRGTLHSISGEYSDQLHDIPGQRLQDGMLVYITSGYATADAEYAGATYYSYRTLPGETRNPLTGALPNRPANWTRVHIDAGAVQDADLLGGYPPDFYYSPINKPTVIQSYEFTDALRWVVEHNRGTVKFVETLTDSEGNRFFAKTRIIDENAFEVVLTSASSGIVDVLFAV